MRSYELLFEDVNTLEQVKMDTNTIVKALTNVAEQLKQHNLKYRLTCAGGIVFLLHFHTRQKIADIDCMFPPPWEKRNIFKKCIENTATTLKLPNDWLNDSIEFFGLETTSNTILFKHPNLTLVSAKFEELLIHKLRSSRNPQDEQDMIVLINSFGNVNKDELWQRIIQYDPKLPTMPMEKLMKRYDNIWAIAKGAKE